jgi:SAM-dependent methyltransferase
MESNHYKTRVTCRLCGHALEPVLDVGDIYLNDFVDEGSCPVKAPLILTKCTECSLVQLRDTSDLDLLYRQYWYKSSLNKSMVAALQDIVDNIEQRVCLQPDDVVVDIGCNDGTLLSQYTNATQLYRIGFDPALNLAEEARKHCDVFYNTYFGDTSISIPKAKVITSIAMFYDLEDPHTFVELVKQNLQRYGIWVIQFTDLLSMMKINAFDTICHEHLEYYSFNVLQELLEQHDFEIFDVEVNEVNGGSVRAYVAHRGIREVEFSVLHLLQEETLYMSSFEDPFLSFALRVNGIKSRVLNFIRDMCAEGEKVFVMGASTKGNTLLQYFGLDWNDLPYAAEVNSDKFGKRTVGTNIPIISETQALDMMPGFFFLLPWHFVDILLKIHEPYLERGGQIIVPMPIPKVYQMVDGVIESREI